MNLIAFSGLATSGKSTASDAYVAKNYARLSFATPIRKMLMALGVTPEEIQAKTTPITWLGGKTPRELLQSLGTEWGRQLVFSEIWVEATRRAILSTLATGQYAGVVLDDCRFDNEAAMIHDLGGLVIRLERPGCSRMSHLSENAISEKSFDLVVDNNFPSIAELNDRIEVAIHFLLIARGLSAA